MGYKVKTPAPCIECGTPTTNRRNYSRAPVCFSCGLQRMVGNLRVNARTGARLLEREKKIMRKRARESG